MGDTRIELVTGPLGGGKTYFAVQRMAAHLAGGNVVVTNVDLVFEGLQKYCAALFGVEIEEQQVRRMPFTDVATFWDHLVTGTGECPVLAVIDEVHLKFNAKDHALLERRAVEFCTQVRKMDIAILFVTQVDSLFVKQLRFLAEVMWVMRDLGKLTVPFLGRICPFPLMAQSAWDVRGKILLEQRVVRKDRRIFACYRTKQLLIDFGLQVAARFKLKKVKKRVTMRMILLFAMIGGALIWGGWKWVQTARDPMGSVGTKGELASSVKPEPKKTVGLIAKEPPVIVGTSVIGTSRWVCVLSRGRCRWREVRQVDMMPEGVVVDGELILWR